MCGIAGFVTATGGAADRMEAAVVKMTNTLIRRGPDDMGVWVDATAGVALGHRRLSILDLSPHGHQPMTSASGRYVIVFNGEVYNFQDIRAQLEKSGPVKWRGHSDTEVMLEAVERYGVGDAIKLFNGMFAFALWDRRERTITFARDRLGKKPLYYCWTGGTLLFGSELKALKAHPLFNAEIDRNSLALFLRHNYIPAPYSIYKGVYKLMPGKTLTVQAPFDHVSPEAAQTYWSAEQAYMEGLNSPLEGDDREIEERFASLLLDSVRIRMISDVPLGAFLSGGVDSSLVVALMKQAGTRPPKTFTIGFFEEGYNEAPHAKAVAQHLVTDHTELYVTPAEAMAVIPDLPEIYDEPFADSSQIPTYLVSRIAREGVTVALSGDGGDESFGGYNRYLWAMSLWRKIGWAPAWARKAAACAITSVPPGFWDAMYAAIEPVLPSRARVARAGDKAHKMAEILGVEDPVEIYRGLVSHFKEPEKVAIGGMEYPTALTSGVGKGLDGHFTRQMMLLDIVSYLPDDILVKVDRASMAVSLETRAPLLDYRVVELAARLPLRYKIRDGKGKWTLRNILYRHVPEKIIERPKMGFGLPIDSWLRGPLKEWAEDLLAEGRLAREGYLSPGPIREKWTEHLSGGRNWQYYLWNALMFQAWLSKNQ
ncbi:MAG: asparagine synthase (glutamine-hydrolyzing) [Nitrospinae bacterium]|nr:asparagine synthase (glutamine-hydrolyzing) [Nitrospinota bacterium]